MFLLVVFLCAFVVDDFDDVVVVVVVVFLCLCFFGGVFLCSGFVSGGVVEVMFEYF